MTLTVCEIFHSIQGESTRAGQPFTFIRLSGCNLRCAWCDTAYAWQGGTTMTVAEIMGRVGEFRCPRVAITGGEPLLQPESSELIQQLLQSDYRVVLETNGSINISSANPKVTRIMDIKCPSSGETESTDWENLTRLTARDEIKFVVADATDYAYAKDQLNRLKPLPMDTSRILFSPVLGQLAPKRLARWILNDRLEVRLQLQLHKLIWDPNERGV